MEFWLLTGEYPPEYGGGIAVYAYHTARMLAERGHVVTVFAATETLASAERSEVLENGIRVVRFGTNQTPQSAALGEFARWSYDAAIVLSDYLQREGAPDVLESQDYLGLAYFTLQRRWLKEAGFDHQPVLVTAHTPLYLCYRYDGVPEYRFPGWWIGEMERFSLAAADQVVFPSATLYEEIRKEWPQAVTNAAMIANPYRKDQPFEAQELLAERRGFLFTAKIERRKGIESLLKAFGRLWDEGMDQPLILLGGDWYDELHQRWMSEVLHRHYQTYMERGLLDWRGKQPPEVVRQTLRQVRGVILPSLFENYPYAVLEAMASGCPVIVSSSGGHAEMVEDGVSGFIFSHQQPGELEQKVRALLHLDQEGWLRMSAAARRRVDELSSYEVVAPQKEAALQQAIERARAQGSRHFSFVRDLPRRSPSSNPPVEQQEGLLSIVVPFYNLGEYLEDTLRSLQGLKDIPHEIIVVDDGSDDPFSLQKLSELKDRYQFRLVRKENEGLAAARNSGAWAASGEFLAFLDADDCVDVEYYRQALRILRCYPELSFVGCWAEYFGEAQGWWPTWNPEPPYALVHNPLNSSALVYRRADFLRFGLNDPAFDQVMEDYDSLLNMLENGCRGVAIPQPYFKYRIRANSMFHASQLPIRQKTYEQLVKKHARLYQQFAVEVTNLLNDNGPGYLYDNPTLWYPQVDFRSTQAPEGQAESRMEMPPASARVYFYFAFRALLLRPYNWVRKRLPFMDKLKIRLKQYFTRGFG
jgi:glycosyltransferase involved in cell wall biosynthesis